MHIRVREFGGIRAVAVAETGPGDLALINNAYALTPLEAADIHVRQARVAHNQHDRTLERFPKAMLERFAETLPGKSLLPGHDKSALPLGRWFRADTRTRTEDFPVLQTAKSEGAEIVPGFSTKAQRVTWLEAAFYFAADQSTEGTRKNIDSGVYQDVSIGFKYDDLDCDVCRKSYLRSDCPHFIGQRLEDKAVLVTATYSGDPKAYEAQETSIVYLGAQQQAELVKQLRTGTLDPQALSQTAWGTDLVQLKGYEALARVYGHQQKAWAFPGLKGVAVGTPAQLPGALALEPPPAIAEGSEEVQTSDNAQDPPVGDPGKAAIEANAEVANGVNDMALLEEARKRLGLADDADEAKVLTEIEEAVKAFKLKTDAEKSLVDAEKALSEARPLAEIGKKALKGLLDEFKANRARLEKSATETALMAEMLEDKGDYEKLKTLVDETFTEVCKRFPTEPKGRVLDEEARTARPSRQLPPQAFRA